MADSDRPQSPFAAIADLSARTPVRVLSPSEIEKILELHQLYLETEYHEGHRPAPSIVDDNPVVADFVRSGALAHAGLWVATRSSPRQPLPP
jgi:hypothetical protein